MIDIATVAVIALPSFAMGAFLAHTFLPAKGKGSPNVCGDALTIERLRQEVDYNSARFHNAKLLVTALNGQIEALEAENRDLHIDIAEKAKRLSDAGLQSAGGCDE